MRLKDSQRQTGTAANFASTRYINRMRVIEAATSRQMASVSSLMAKNIVACGGDSLQSRAGRITESQSRFAKYRNAFEQNWKRGKISVLDHVDFEQVIKESLSDRDLRVLECKSEQYRSDSIQEGLVSAITSDWLSHLLVDSIRYGVIERTELQPPIHLQMVDTNLRLAPGADNKLVKFRTEADVVDDDMSEEEAANAYAPAPPILVTLPKPKKKNFIMRFTREALTVAPNNILREEIDRHGSVMDLHIEKLLIDLLWGLFDHVTPRNRFPYIESGVTIHPYQTVGGAGPWENELVDNDLDGTQTPFTAIEQVLDDRRDPYSGEPVQHGGLGKTICTTRNQVRNAVQGLGVIQLGQDLAGASNKRQAVEIPAGQFDIDASDITYSTLAKDRVAKWYQTAAGGSKSASAAKTAAEQTWLNIQPSAAACYCTEWEREKLTREGEDTLEYFQQDVIYSAKWTEKSTVGWKDPQRSIRNKKS